MHPKNLSWILVAHRTTRPREGWPSWAPHWETLQENIPRWAINEIRDLHDLQKSIPKTPILRYPALEVSVTILDTIDGMFSTFSYANKESYRPVRLQHNNNPDLKQQAKDIFSELYDAMVGTRSKNDIYDYKTSAYAFYLYCDATTKQNIRPREAYENVADFDWARVNSATLLHGKPMVEDAGDPTVFGNPTFGIKRKGKQSEVLHKMETLRDSIFEADRMKMRLVITLCVGLS